MKKPLLLLLLVFSLTSLSAQDINGDWFGTLNVQGFKLPLVFHIKTTDTATTVKMDSPSQKAFGIPASTARFESDTLHVGLKSLGASYSGFFDGARFTGTFKQLGNSFPLDLYPELQEEEPLKRPQEPQPPFPYATEEVVFQNDTAMIKLAGTLSIPQGEGPFPAVVLISGSGPQDRDETLMGHKPFLLIADYLTRKGIAVLRYDDRGVGDSKGVFGQADSADFATDVEAAMAYLKTRPELNVEQLGLIGHSEGGLIAPLVATQTEDVAFMVLLAGPGVPGDRLLLEQEALIARAGGASEEAIATAQSRNKALFYLVSQFENKEALAQVLEDQINAFIDEEERVDFPQEMNRETYVKKQANQLANPWMMYFIKHNPAFVLESVTCPVLALNGSNDLQVSAAQNLPAIEAALKAGGNTQVTIKEFDGLNHLFQESATGAPSEYAAIEQTMAPIVLETITSWILKQTEE